MTDTQTTLRTLRDHIERVGDELQGEIDGTTEAGEPASGYACLRGGASYQVMTVPSIEFVRVTFPYDAVQDLAVNQAVDPNAVGPIEVELEETQLQDARATLRERVDEDDREAIRQGLEDRLLDPAVAVQFEADPEGFLRGFEVSRKLFPDRVGFDVAAFDRAVQAVVTVGLRGQRFLADRFDIQPAGGALDGGGPDHPGAFQ